MPMESQKRQKKTDPTSRILRLPQLNHNTRQRLLTSAHLHRVSPIRETGRNGDFSFGQRRAGEFLFLHTEYGHLPLGLWWFCREKNSSRISVRFGFNG